MGTQDVVCMAVPRTTVLCTSLRSEQVVINTDVQQLAGVPKYSVEMDIEQTIQIMDIWHLWVSTGWNGGALRTV